MDSLNTIKSQYYKVARQLSAPNTMVRFALTEQHDGGAHAAIDGDEYVYATTERGETYETRRTRDSDDFLFWFVQHLVFEMACKFELANRRSNEDFRRQMFAKQIDLFGQISQEWAARQQGEIDEILSKHPYDDSSGPALCQPRATP